MRVYAFVAGNVKTDAMSAGETGHYDVGAIFSHRCNLEAPVELPDDLACAEALFQVSFVTRRGVAKRGPGGLVHSDSRSF